MVQQEVCFWGGCVCMLVHLSCMWTVLFCLLFVCELTGCGWGLRWWGGQQCLLLLVLLKKKCLRAEHEMWQSVHWLLPSLLDSTIVSCLLLHTPISAPTALVCVCVDWCVRWVTKCFCVHCLWPTDDLSCLREILWFPSCFFLLASPFQWFWHCYGEHALNCCRPSPFLSIWPTSTLFTNCACEAQHRKKSSLESESGAGKRCRCRSVFCSVSHSLLGLGGL